MRKSLHDVSSTKELHKSQKAHHIFHNAHPENRIRTHQIQQTLHLNKSTVFDMKIRESIVTNLKYFDENQ